MCSLAQGVPGWAKMKVVDSKGRARVHGPKCVSLILKMTFSSSQEGKKCPLEKKTIPQTITVSVILRAFHFNFWINMDKESKYAVENALKDHENGSKINCMAIFDAFWYCGNPGSQMGHYYKHGTYEDCMTYMSDWGRCLKLKGTYDQDKRKELIDAMTTLPKLPPVAGTTVDSTLPHVSAEIWQLEETPKWAKKL